jgi:glycerol-1-phosphate dehydrogenase [NAD(P)+]
LPNPLHIYIGTEALPALIDYCRVQDLQKFLMVVDENTYPALGRRVEEALSAQGYDIITALLSSREVIADARHLFQVFLKVDQKERTFLAVGSGTITDITRFISHRTRSSFISLPTAPSVDGFNSIGAPLVIEGLKQTILCQPPVALFADLPTLCAAPPAMIASGFGDMVGKLLSIADWKLGNLLWDEPYDEEILQRSRRAALRTSEYASEIGRGCLEGIHVLMDGLIESGFCMLDFGDSSPASGAEHHISHYWEMKLLQEKRPAILHGAKVGLASIYCAQWYAAMQDLSLDEVASRLADARLQDPEQVIADIHAVYGSIAEILISAQAEFICMSPENFDALKSRILACWDQVLAIARNVPSPAQVEEWLHRAGGPASGAEIGLSDEEVILGLEYGHYLRKRFTINKLRKLLNIP